MPLGRKYRGTTLVLRCGVDLPARKRIVAAVMAEWGIPPSRANSSKAPSARELERLGTRAENRGCDACATRFAQWQPYFIARTKRNTWSARCDACVAGCAEVAIVGACGGPAADPYGEKITRRINRLTSVVQS
jgi:hypothetical protein